MRIENFVMRVTVIPSDKIFNSHHTAIMDLFFLYILPLTIAFKLEYALFNEFYAKLSQFVVKKCSLWLLSMMLTSKRLAENGVKIYVRTSKRQSDVMHEMRVVLHPHHPCVRQHFLAPVSDEEIPVKYARNIP